MKWANFLHIYQPADQQPDILEAIIAQSYRPIFTNLLENPRVRLTLNVSGALLELFDKYGYRDLLDILRTLAESGRVEFTSSSKYHAFLPFISADEMKRQIVANNETLAYYLGDAFKPKGFFPPEMAYNRDIVPIIESLGFEWIILDEIACAGVPGEVDYTKIYKIKDSKLKVFFRERRLSNLIMSAVVRSPETLEEAMKDDMKSGRYAITGMDGETFGHHRPGLEKMLFDIFSDKNFDLITISEILDFYKEQIEIEPIVSTWASTKEDIDKGIQFLSWSDPDNMIHGWQKELLDMTLAAVNGMDKTNAMYDIVRKRMDSGMSSDPFFWASAKPWWSVEMIEAGAYQLIDIIRAVPGVPKDELDKASSLYEKIISKAFTWQRTGKIREMFQSQKSILRIPFKDRTFGTPGKEHEYQAFLDMMKRLELKASKIGEYEKAILWRDAAYKLENKLDIYDTINVIDLLRVEIPNEEVDKTLEKYREQYLKIRGGQPEQRGG